ncbi:IS630 family transposase [Cupriavidus necator]|uniref:IS630 family transposase n=2 Tax=Cupriavidus necator TaxID=106590 RepID=UPI0005B494A5|nr:IS630 family transposase [Cupriavidus necator]
MKRDGRTLDRATQEEFRRLALRRVREGEKPSVVVKSLGMNRTSIYRWLKAASGPGKGARALASRPATGRPRKLTRAQQAQVFRWINGRDPRQYGLDFGLWTRQIVATLIDEKFDVKMGVTAVGRLLAGLGLSPQKPLQRTYQRDPQAVERWQRESFPGIAAAAKQSGADIYFWDESGFRADAVHGKTWAVKGETPVIERPGQRQSISAASAVNAKGAFWFATYKGALTAELFIELLKKMMKGRNRPVHLIVDGLPAHKKANVREYIESTKGKLTMHVLPGYAPDLNPDEFVWSHLKRTGVARNPLRAGEKLEIRVEQHLHEVKKNRRLVRSFFDAPSVAYISDC